MRIDIITCVPDLLVSPFAHSIMQRAQDKGLATVHLHNLRDYAINKQAQIDDYMFGGGAGMVLMVEPIAKCIRGLQAERDYDEVIYLTPDGVPYTQAAANRLSLKQNLILLCGHYKGIDERARELFVTSEISIGDYVISGGELAAAVVADSVIRLIPGVLSDETSALTDSFQDQLLSPPVYTRPASFEGLEVPEILRSGDHKRIGQWREQQAIQRTRQRRPDLLGE
ncbi:tRNA (guanosine(37)-N1)-methyltransferase TrmD [Eisenibacter elegans]|jgi:tRNA (guanine37-N1)-methyltransferase|uniref:tRNA (guanosine(37)-N1)-methyltransferase TrmD n=1 Tax=Eisenibacter elegans TaxID=997 RepID=UPI0003FC4007|nr:tRNA (guanosine(37)-N1)-methyltransferase TrmD [Eisenibacter elegans]